ncbi:putative septum site-determining protein MinC [Rhodovastum atsumiense]|nr:septum site-determining protein MinC [Rhodovastum atsumiense]CAH2604214.1 putative septum site-determining protein MinC [Rhodovastum atsumiense]
MEQWLAELDAQVTRSPVFLDGKPVLLDLGGVTAQDADLLGLARALQARGLRIVGVENAEPGWPGAAEFGPAFSGGRPTGAVELPSAAQPATPPPAAEEEPAGLVIDSPVRSGQSVIYPKGDVTVLGSVASGAEVFAGGSVHIYGTLRGRVVAGFTGNPKARVFCRRLEAELVAIDGVYRTADDMDESLRGRAVQAWLDGDSIVMTTLD